MDGSKYSEAFQFGEYWFKLRKNGDEKHILLSDTKTGLDNKSFQKNKVKAAHDHYYFKDGKYHAQIRSTNAHIKTKNKKGHILDKNQVFDVNIPLLEKRLDSFFSLAESIVDLN